MKNLPPKTDPLADLMAAGFTSVQSTTPRRLLINSQGLERKGKTYWAVKTTPGPIAYIGLDFGHEGVVNKAADDKRIVGWYKNIPPVANQSEYLKHWQETHQAISRAMNHPGIRTVVLDSGSDIWELLRLAEFGKLNQVGDIKKLYPQINQAYRSLIRMAYDSEKNLVITHKVKKHYKTKMVSTSKGQQEMEYWDGESYERAGFGEGGYLVQVQIEHLFDGSREGDLENKFGIRVLDCRQNMDIVGMTLWGEECSFPVLAQYIFPDSDESDWV